MVTQNMTLPNSVYEALRQLTGKSKIDEALPIALKDLLKLKKQSLQEKIAGFEKKYGMSFSEFEEACENGQIKDPFSYEVEKDDWEWEAALTDQNYLQEIEQWLE